MSMHTAPPCTCDTCPTQPYTSDYLRSVWLADKPDRPSDRAVVFCIGCGDEIPPRESGFCAACEEWRY